MKLLNKITHVNIINVFMIFKRKMVSLIFTQILLLVIIINDCDLFAQVKVNYCVYQLPAAFSGEKKNVIYIK